MSNLPSIKVPADVTRSTLNFVQRVLGPVAEASDFLTDKIRFWRWQSAIKTMERARQIAGRARIKPKAVPLSFLVPFLEKASLEGVDSELTELWARLLASAAKGFQDKHKIFLSILSELTTSEVRILRQCRAQGKLGSGQRSQPYDGLAITRVQLSPKQRSSTANSAKLTKKMLRSKAVSVEDAVKLLQYAFDQFDLKEMKGKAPDTYSFSILLSPGSNRKEREQQHIDTISLLNLERKKLVTCHAFELNPIGGSAPISLLSARLTPLGAEFVACCEGKL